MSYKKLLPYLLKSASEQSLYKNEQHPTSRPHVIFSVENPLYDANLEMSHEDTLNHFRSKGYPAHHIVGNYGGAKENAIMIENPSKKTAHAILRMARGLGQESIIYSDGKGNHELHYVNGPKRGKHYKGYGTNLPTHPPDSNYSIMEDGSVFSYNFDFGTEHSHDKSMIKMNEDEMKKSEKADKKVYIPQKIAKSEIRAKTPLIHYSPEEGLTEVSPKFHGKRKIGLESKHGAPEHKLAFFYREGAKPEEVVTTGARSKYVAHLEPGHRIYDLGEDSEGIRPHLKSLADKKMVNTGVFTNDDIHEELKNRGYTGFYNSKSSLPNVVAMFHSLPVHREHKLHPNDFKIASAKDHHLHEELHQSAKQSSQESGHHDPSFLSNLAHEFHNED